MKRRIGCLSILGLFVSLLIPKPLPAAEEKAAGEKVRITYAANTLSFLVMFLAKDRGFYKKYGLEADLVQVRPNIAITALLSGAATYTHLMVLSIFSASKGAFIR